MSDTRIPSLDGTLLNAYSATPRGGYGPGLIVIHDTDGLNNAMRAACEAFAKQGCVAVAPDLFWRQNKAEGQKPPFDIEAGVRDLLAVLAYTRRMPECNSKVGVLGYGLGGTLAYLMSARSDVECGIGYGGNGLEKYLEDVHDIRLPFLLHLAENDPVLPPATQQKIQDAAKRYPVVTVYVYPDATAAFANVGTSPSTNETLETAERHTMAFLAENLLGG